MSTEPRARALQTSLTNLAECKRAVEDAEEKLEALLSEIRVAPRAEKTAVSSAIESALERLRLARAKVVDAESTISREAAQ